MRKNMTLKSNALSQGTRRPEVHTLRTVSHLAGDKMPWSPTVKLLGFSPELLPLRRWFHDPGEERGGCESGITALGVGKARGHTSILSFPEVTLLGWHYPSASGM